MVTSKNTETLQEAEFPLTYYGWLYEGEDSSRGDHHPIGHGHSLDPKVFCQEKGKQHEPSTDEVR